jgi:hypothetical protein
MAVQNSSIEQHVIVISYTSKKHEPRSIESKMTSGVRLSAASLSQLLSHTMRRSGGDDEIVEGLLFGIYRKVPRRAKSATDDDNDVDNSTSATDIEVEGCVALGASCSFYAPSGAVHVPTVKALVARLDASATVVGWFRCKMRPMSPLTLREVAVLRSLQAISPRLAARLRLGGDASVVRLALARLSLCCIADCGSGYRCAIACACHCLQFATEFRRRVCRRCRSSHWRLGFSAPPPPPPVCNRRRLACRRMSRVCKRARSPSSRRASTLCISSPLNFNN